MFSDYSVVVDALHYRTMLEFNDFQFHSHFRMRKEQFYRLFNVLKLKDINLEHIDLLIYLYRMGHGVGYRICCGFFKRSIYKCQLSFKAAVLVLNNVYNQFIYYPPRTTYVDIAATFQPKTNRLDILGAMDGTLIRIEQPRSFPNSYYSRKGFFALHMLAVCDWSYCFWYIQVGDVGNTHDSMAFLDSSLYSDIISGQLNLNQDNISYKILTDSAFRRQSFLLKTNATDYHRRQFLHEYKEFSIESGRTCIECIFGILTNRFHFYQSRIRDNTIKIKWIVISSCVVHNFLMRDALNMNVD